MDVMAACLPLSQHCRFTRTGRTSTPACSPSSGRGSVTSPRPHATRHAPRCAAAWRCSVAAGGSAVCWAPARWRPAWSPAASTPASTGTRAPRRHRRPHRRSPGRAAAHNTADGPARPDTASEQLELGSGRGRRPRGCRPRGAVRRRRLPRLRDVGHPLRARHLPRLSGPPLHQPRARVGGRLDGDAMPDRPDWVAPDDDAIWAPAPARIGDRYVLYFAATAARSGRRHEVPRGRDLRVAGGAVRPTSRPTALHARLLEHRPLPGQRRPWLVPALAPGRRRQRHRQDRGIQAGPRRPPIASMAGPTTTTLLVGAFSWEEGYPEGTPGIGPIENPAMARHPATGQWLLTWSANRWETQDYATGLAVCDRTAGALPADGWRVAVASHQRGPGHRHHGPPGRRRWPVVRRRARRRALCGAARVSVAPVRLPGPCGWRGRIGSNPPGGPLDIG